MATLSYVQAKTSALAQSTWPSAAAGGDKVAPAPNGALLFLNGDAASKIVTLLVPGNTVYGVANPDPTFTVPAGGTCVIGPLTYDLADPADGLVAFTYSAVTSCKVQPILI